MERFPLPSLLALEPMDPYLALDLALEPMDPYLALDLALEPMDPVPVDLSIYLSIYLSNGTNGSGRITPPSHHHTTVAMDPVPMDPYLELDRAKEPDR